MDAVLPGAAEAEHLRAEQRRQNAHRAHLGQRALIVGVIGHVLQRPRRVQHRLELGRSAAV
eukprot:856381-Pleurochrysis_carterae.AAC.1